MPKNPKPTEGSKTDKAKTVAKKISKPIRRKGHVVRTAPRFYRPTTQVQKRNPKVIRHINKYNNLRRIDTVTDRVIIQPLSSEKNMARMEKENTIAFLVSPYANKVQIRHAFTKLYQAKVRSVNTLIRPDGQKKAFVRLAPGTEALKVASKIGIL